MVALVLLLLVMNLLLLAGLLFLMWRTGRGGGLARLEEKVDALGKSEDTLRYEGKIDATLEQVRAQLESVQRGLGAMQTLASDVDSLERTLSGVKTRGIWGEVQLEAIVADLFNPRQYEMQSPISEHGRERVDCVIRLPRKHGGDAQVLLPIDAKFPLTHYERIVEASEAGDKEAVAAASKELAKAVGVYAKSIKEKYVAPPRTTDFAVMYVPTEGLFAEVARMPGLLDTLRREHKVMVSGPVNLGAILGTIQLGYQLVAIEGHSREVWETLARVRREFEKFGEGLDGVTKSLRAASNKMDQMETRQRQMQRVLESADGVPPPS